MFAHRNFPSAIPSFTKSQIAEECIVNLMGISSQPSPCYVVGVSFFAEKLRFSFQGPSSSDLGQMPTIYECTNRLNCTHRLTK